MNMFSEPDSENDCDLSRLLAEFERELIRVGVDWDVAAGRMRETAHDLALRTAGSDDILIGLDVETLLAVLRPMPAHAGTDAFLARVL